MQQHNQLFWTFIISYHSMKLLTHWPWIDIAAISEIDPHTKPPQLTYGSTSSLLAASCNCIRICNIPCIFIQAWKLNYVGASHETRYDCCRRRFMSIAPNNHPSTRLTFWDNLCLYMSEQYTIWWRYIEQRFICCRRPSVIFTIKSIRNGKSKVCVNVQTKHSLTVLPIKIQLIQ